MKNYLIHLFFLLSILNFALAQDMDLLQEEEIKVNTISRIENKKYKNQKIEFNFDYQNELLIVDYYLGGVKERLNSFQTSMNNLGQLELINNDKVYNMEVINATMQASGDIFTAYGEDVLPGYFDFCYNNAFLCYFPVPSVGAVVPAVTVGMSVAGAATFLAGILTAPIDGAITFIAHLSNPASISKRKVRKALNGKSLKISDKVFIETINQIKKL